MNNSWWCADCWTAVQLDQHGRCDTCGSEAVDPIERRPAPWIPTTSPNPFVTQLPQYAGAL